MTVPAEAPDQKALACDAVCTDLKTFYISLKGHATQISLERFRDAWIRADLSLLHRCLTVPELGNQALSLFINHNPSPETSPLASILLFYTLHQIYFTQSDELKESFRFGLERLSLLAALRDEAEGTLEGSDAAAAFDRLWSNGAFSCIVYERLSLTKPAGAASSFSPSGTNVISHYQATRIIERLTSILRHLAGGDATPSACSLESFKKLRSTVLKYRMAAGNDTQDRIMELLAEIEKVMKEPSFSAANKPAAQQPKKPTRQDIRARLGREKLMAVGSTTPPGQGSNMFIDWATGTVVNKRSASVPPPGTHTLPKRRKSSHLGHGDAHSQQSGHSFQFQLQAQMQTQEAEDFVLEDMPQLEF